MNAAILPAEFYQRSTLEVASDLLGKMLIRRYRGVVTGGRIVEVEAYLGSHDPASHAARRMTPRNQVMFGPPGKSYVYFTYGMYHCFNVVTEVEGRAGAVLIRALEPIFGIELMQRRRCTKKLNALCSGPAKLCQALYITLSNNRQCLMSPQLQIVDDGFVPTNIATTGRIGISQGAELPYRFICSDALPWLSIR